MSEYFSLSRLQQSLQGLSRQQQFCRAFIVIMGAPSTSELAQYQQRLRETANPDDITKVMDEILDAFQIKNSVTVDTPIATRETIPTVSTPAKCELPITMEAPHSFSNMQPVELAPKSDIPESKAVLCDRQILAAMEAGKIIISPFKRDNLKNCQYDITLGQYYYRVDGDVKFCNPSNGSSVRKMWSQWRTATTVETRLASKLYCVPIGTKVILLKPRESILVHSEEFIGGRVDITTMAKARSTLGRCAISAINNCGWGDIGFYNRWSFSVTNNSHVRQVLTVGERFAQIIFLQTAVPERDYLQTGQYQKVIDLDELKKKWHPEDMLPNATFTPMCDVNVPSKKYEMLFVFMDKYGTFPESYCEKYGHDFVTANDRHLTAYSFFVLINYAQGKEFAKNMSYLPKTDKKYTHICFLDIRNDGFPCMESNIADLIEDSDTVITSAHKRSFVLNVADASSKLVNEVCEISIHDEVICLIKVTEECIHNEMYCIIPDSGKYLDEDNFIQFV